MIPVEESTPRLPWEPSEAAAGSAECERSVVHSAEPEMTRMRWRYTAQKIADRMFGWQERQDAFAGLTRYWQEYQRARHEIMRSRVLFDAAVSIDAKSAELWGFFEAPSLEAAEFARRVSYLAKRYNRNSARPGSLLSLSRVIRSESPHSDGIGFETDAPRRCEARSRAPAGSRGGGGSRRGGSRGGSSGGGDSGGDGGEGSGDGPSRRSKRSRINWPALGVVLTTVQLLVGIVHPASTQVVVVEPPRAPHVQPLRANHAPQAADPGPVPAGQSLGRGREG